MSSKNLLLTFEERDTILILTAYNIEDKFARVKLLDGEYDDGQIAFGRCAG